VSADTSTIHDLGYRNYSGPRLGRGHALRALYLHSLRGAFGIGRGGKAKILPFAILAIMCAPAVISVAVVSQTGTDGIRYDAYPFLLQLPIVIFLAAQASEMLSRDLRFRVLSLYFSRPAARDDYATAKLAAMTTALLVLMGLPLLILYLGTVFSADKGLGNVWDETTALAPALANVAVHALVIGAIGLAVAAFSKRRAYGTGAVVALFLITNTLSGFASIASGTIQKYSGLIAPFNLLDGFKQWVLHGKPAGADVGSAGPYYAVVTVAVLAIAVAVLIARYRKVAA